MGRKRSYTEEEKILAVVAYVVHRTLSGAAAQSGIPRQTIQSWKKDNPTWWEQVVAEAWEQEEERIRSRYGEIVDKGTAAQIDRIEHGDTRVNTKGELYKVPASLRDLTIAVGTMQDKLNISRGKPTSISGQASGMGIGEKMEALKQDALKNQNEIREETIQAAVDRGEVVKIKKG